MIISQRAPDIESDCTLIKELSCTAPTRFCTATLTC
jgi:hypothetical protein